MNMAAPETELSRRAAPRRLRLRTLSEGAAAAERGLARRFAPVSVDVAGGRMGFALDTTPAPMAEAAGIPRLALTIDGHDAWLALDWGLARRLACEPVEGADPSDAALLLEEAVAAWLDAGEAATGLSLRFLGLGAAEPPAEALRRGLLVQGRAPRGSLVRQRLPLALSPGAALALAQRLASDPGAKPPAALVLRASLEREARWLTARELRSLRPGDAVVLGPDPAARLVVEGGLAAPVTLGPQGVRLDGPLRPIAEETPPMPDAPEDEGIDAVELRVSFRAGERLMTLAEVRSLAPGSVVDLPGPPDAEVEIVVNGRVIGRGELVEVAGRRAVQVRTLE